MGIRFHALIITILGSCIFTGTSWAQDAGMSDVEIVDEINLGEGEKMLYSPGEAEVRYIPKAANLTERDSFAIQVVNMPAVQPGAREAASKANKKEPAKGEDDSILSFNFLYYIIQKYKLQDIID